MLDRSPLADELADTSHRTEVGQNFGLYLGVSAVFAVMFISAIFSVPFLMSGFDPITVASSAIGDERLTDRPVVVANDRDFRLIEPAAGPGCDN